MAYKWHFYCSIGHIQIWIVLPGYNIGLYQKYMLLWQLHNYLHYAEVFLASEPICFHSYYCNDIRLCKVIRLWYSLKICGTEYLFPILHMHL